MLQAVAFLNFSLAKSVSSLAFTNAASVLMYSSLALAAAWAKRATLAAASLFLAARLSRCLTSELMSERNLLLGWTLDVDVAVEGLFVKRRWWTERMVGFL